MLFYCRVLGETKEHWLIIIRAIQYYKILLSLIHVFLTFIYYMHLPKIQYWKLLLCLVYSQITHDIKILHCFSSLESSSLEIFAQVHEEHVYSSFLVDILRTQIRCFLLIAIWTSFTWVEAN